MPLAELAHVLAFGVLASHLALGAMLILIAIPHTRRPTLAAVGTHALLLAFLTGLFATALSLFYSEIAGFQPCTICWYQRIFMYPQVILLGVALVKKEDVILDYALSLASAGTLFSLYHNYIYYGGASLFPCTAFGLGVSCVRRYVWELGYITIPLMSLTSFLLLIFFLASRRYIKKKSLL